MPRIRFARTRSVNRVTPIAMAEQRNGGIDPVPVILLLLAIPMGISVWRVSTTHGALVEPPAIRTMVNPNLAPWWELAALPGIGETKARQIVAYRETHADRSPVFLTPADLEPVSGIGPKTIQRIARYLCFED